jgi:hypothetical protein
VLTDKLTQPYVYDTQQDARCEKKIRRTDLLKYDADNASLNRSINIILHLSDLFCSQF